MAPASKAAGVPWIGFHTFRHTYASRLLAGGKNIAQMSKWLGHADPASTLSERARATWTHDIHRGNGPPARRIVSYLWKPTPFEQRGYDKMLDHHVAVNVLPGIAFRRMGSSDDPVGDARLRQGIVLYRGSSASASNRRTVYYGLRSNSRCKQRRDAVVYGDVAFNPFKAVRKPSPGPSRLVQRRPQVGLDSRELKRPAS